MKSRRERLTFVLGGSVIKFFSITLIFLLAIQGAGVKSVAHSAITDERIPSLVSELSWDSVGGECNGIWRIYPDGTAAKELIQIGKPATAELLKALSDENRGVAVHLILTAIWEPGNVTYGSWVQGNATERTWFFHIYNGLKWADVIDFKRVAIRQSVEPIELIRNLKAWQSKLSKYRIAKNDPPFIGAPVSKHH